MKQLHVVAIAILILAAAGAFFTPPATVSGQAYKLVTRYAETCLDTDSGDNPYGKGTAFITKNMGFQESLTDYCNSRYEVIEYQCLGNTLVEKAYRCSSLNGDPNSECVEGGCTV
jgi:hypothetical protein|tara:strand:- start:219 stop:563 length:345 start_codon:yes stop_codon:yes gene_type:complete